MTFNNGGLNDALHGNRVVHRDRWQPSNDASQPAGTQVLGWNDNRAQVTPQPWGHEASLDRADRYETNRYEAGPFKTEFRAQAAAAAMMDRENVDLQKYRTGSTPH